MGLDITNQSVGKRNATRASPGVQVRPWVLLKRILNTKDPLILGIPWVPLKQILNTKDPLILRIPWVLPWVLFFEKMGGVDPPFLKNYEISYKIGRIA